MIKHLGQPALTSVTSIADAGFGYMKERQRTRQVAAQCQALVTTHGLSCHAAQVVARETTAQVLAVCAVLPLCHDARTQRVLCQQLGRILDNEPNTLASLPQLTARNSGMLPGFEED
jgi:hypothetical protein